MDLLQVIETIASGISVNPNIYAMWLEGSWATGKNNEHSDIDVWLDVEDGCFDSCIAYFRDELKKVGDIDWEDARGIYSENPKLIKQIFHLAGFPKDQTVELDIQEHSRNFVFNKNDHIIKVIFDKNGTIIWGKN